jgi:hypothetical protein
MAKLNSKILKNEKNQSLVGLTLGVPCYMLYFLSGNFGNNKNYWPNWPGPDICELLLKYLLGL